MKVSKLIKLLQKQDPKAEVIMSSDSEGNSFSIVQGFSNDSVYRQVDGEIEFGFLKMTPSMRRQGYSDEELMTDGKPAIVFYP